MNLAFSTIAEPITAGVVAGIGSIIAAPEIPQLNIPFINQSFSTPISIGIIAATGSLISSTLSNYAVPMVSNARYGEFLADTFPAVGSGVVAYYLVKAGDSTGGGQSYSAAKLGLLTSVSNYVGQSVGQIMNYQQV